MFKEEEGNSGHTEGDRARNGEIRSFIPPLTSGASKRLKVSEQSFKIQISRLLIQETDRMAAPTDRLTEEQRKAVVDSWELVEPDATTHGLGFFQQ